jgi:hypothetical protein
LEFSAQVAAVYARLIESPYSVPESGLGGKLLYAAELDEAGREFIVAANIAGAATLAATADRAAQKQALRDGVVDFPVNSLDEALRILKNQLRKRETVAICVALEPESMEREMNERGVAPDLHRRQLPMIPRREIFDYGEDDGQKSHLKAIPPLVTWRSVSGSQQELARLDEIALACLDAGDWAARRWLRLSPRFLGRMAHGLRLLANRVEFGALFAEQVRQSIASGRLSPSVEIEICAHRAEQRMDSHPREPA